MVSRLLACLPLVLLASLAPARADTKPLLGRQDVAVKVRAKPTAGPAFVHHGPARVLAVGTNELAGVSFEMTPGKKHPTVAWTAEGKERSETLKKAKGHRLVLQAKPKRCLFVFKDLFGAWHHLPGEGLRFSVRGLEFEVLDADHDGTWFETDEDLIRRVGDDHAVPLRAQHVVEDWTLAVRSFDPERKALELTLEPIDRALNAEERAVLATLNRERERMGYLGTVALPRWSEPLRLHARWMAMHGKVQHHEEPNTAGYTAEGHNAGGASVILTHPRDVDIATYVDIDSPIHGHVLTMPEFVQTGVGAMRREHVKHPQGGTSKAEGSTVYGGLWTMELHGFKHAKVESVRFPQVWPPHMATGVPRSWTTEGEDPRPPEDRGREQGYPIRVYLTPGVNETADLKDLKVTLFAQGKPREPLECFVIAPDRPLPYEPSPFLRHLLGVLKPIFVLPRPVLKAETWYVLRLEGTVGGTPLEHQTAFRTGDLRGQYRNLKIGDKRIGR